MTFTLTGTADELKSSRGLKVSDTKHSIRYQMLCFAYTPEYLQVRRLRSLS